MQPGQGPGNGRIIGVTAPPSQVDVGVFQVSTHKVVALLPPGGGPVTEDFLRDLEAQLDKLSLERYSIILSTPAYVVLARIKAMIKLSLDISRQVLPLS